MGVGEFLIFFFVFAIFIGGITIGYKLYKWNMKDHMRRKERNEKIKTKQNEKTQ
jgi:Flp pilus assembly protein TadB